MLEGLLKVTEKLLVNDYDVSGVIWGDANSIEVEDVPRIFNTLVDDEVLNSQLELLLAIRNTEDRYEDANAKFVLFFNSNPVWSIDFRQIVSERKSTYAGLKKEAFAQILQAALDVSQAKGESKEQYIIVSEEGFWSNEEGWCYSYDDATRFNDVLGNLPIGKKVRWEPAVDYQDKKAISEMIEHLVLKLSAYPDESKESEKINDQLVILNAALQSVYSITTPNGLISVIPSSDPAYPRVHIDINGEQAAVIEYPVDDQVFKVHVWLEKDHSNDASYSIIWDDNDTMEVS